METPFHQFKDLFAQLGLDNKPEDIRAFIDAHAPLSTDIRLEDAPFWTPVQSEFLRQALDVDGDWAETVDLLNAELRAHDARSPVTENTDLPKLNIRLVGRGEAAMRMEKRLRCAGRAVGVTVTIDWKSDEYGEPVVYVGDKILVDHLIGTEEIERLLAPYAPPSES